MSFPSLIPRGARMRDEDPFAATTRKFLSYFQRTQPFLARTVELRDLRRANRGRGLVAKADIPAGEDLFSVSRSQILSAENSDLYKNEVGRQLLARLDDPWLSLILALIYESERSTSQWCDYIFLLQDAPLDTLINWTDTDLHELQASKIKDKIGKQRADKDFGDFLVPAIKSNATLFPSASEYDEESILELAHWAGSRIMAYAFDLEKRPSTPPEDGYVSDVEEAFLPKGLVPMADMLNADADLYNTRLFYEDDVVVMRTIKPVKAGEELLNDYGPLPRADLLRRYGYMTDNYAKYDVVEIDTSFIEGQVLGSAVPGTAARSSAEVELALEDLECREDAYIISTYAEADDEEDPLFPDDLKMLIYYQTSPPDSKKARRPEEIETRYWPRMYGAYLDVLKARLAEYGTTIAQDRQMILDLGVPKSEDCNGLLSSSGDTHLVRKAKAIHVRLGEKLILQRAMEHITALAESTTTTNGHTNGTPPTKRARLTNGHG